MSEMQLYTVYFICKLLYMLRAQHTQTSLNSTTTATGSDNSRLVPDAVHCYVFVLLMMGGETT